MIRFRRDSIQKGIPFTAQKTTTKIPTSRSMMPRAGTELHKSFSQTSNLLLPLPCPSAFPVRTRRRAEKPVLPSQPWDLMCLHSFIRNPPPRFKPPTFPSLRSGFIRTVCICILHIPHPPISISSILIYKAFDLPIFCYHSISLSQNLPTDSPFFHLPTSFKKKKKGSRFRRPALSRGIRGQAKASESDTAFIWDLSTRVCQSDCAWNGMMDGT